jgi:hypothetical protein
MYAGAHRSGHLQAGHHLNLLSSTVWLHLSTPVLITLICITSSSHLLLLPGALLLRLRPLGPCAGPHQDRLAAQGIQCAHIDLL